MAFNPNQLQLVASFERPGILFAMCYDRAAGTLYGAGTDGAVYSVDLDAEEPAATNKWEHHDNYVSSLVWVNGTIVSGGFDRRLIWTDAESGERCRVIDSAHDGWVRDLAVFPDKERFVSVGDDMLVKIWDRRTGKLLDALAAHDKQTPQGFSTALYTVAVSPDGMTIATGDRIGRVCLWNAESGQLIRRLSAPTFYTYDDVKRARSLGGIRSVAFSADGSRLAVAGIGPVTNVDGFVGPCRIEVWDWQSDKRVFTGQDQHKAVLNHVSFHPTEPWVFGAGGGDDGGVVAFWDQSEEVSQHKTKHAGHIQRFIWESAGERLFTVGSGGFHVYGPADGSS